MAPYYSTLAWKIPWMEEPGRLQSMGLLRVRHDWVTSLSLFTFMHWRRKWLPTPVFLPGESQGRGSLVGCHLWGHLRVGHDWSDLAAAAAAREEMRYWIKYLSFGVRPGLKSELQFLLCVMGKRRPPYRATVKTNWDSVPKCSALTPSFSSLSRLVLPVTLGFTYQSWEFRTICLLLILLTAFPLTRLQ